VNDGLAIAASDALLPGIEPLLTSLSNLGLETIPLMGPPMTELLLSLLSGDLRRISSNTISLGGLDATAGVINGCVINGSVGTGGPVCAGGKDKRNSRFDISRGSASFSDLTGVSLKVFRSEPDVC